MGRSVVAAGIAAVVGLASVARGEPGTGPLRVWIETPRDGSQVASADPHVVVAGRVLSAAGALDQYDLVLVVDRSKSTDHPTGVDIDGDGHVGRAPDSRYVDGASDDRGDSVLAAEVVAAHTLLDQLDPRTTRAAVVAFSGDMDPDTPDAETLAPLDSSYARAHEVLDDLLDEWPSGRTNLAAALHTATAELLGVGSARSAARRDAHKIVLLMTDGQPTLPIPFGPEENAQATFEAARLAARAGIRVDTFAIGQEANRDPRVTSEVADLTGGRFTPVLEPRDLMSTFENLRWTQIEALEALNRTTGAQADTVLLESDGRFAALVPLEPGENRLEIRVRGSSGRTTWRALRVELLAGGSLAPLHPRWLSQRTRLLEQRLVSLRRRQVMIETRREARDLRDHLRAASSAARARDPERAVEIEVEELPASPALP